MRKGSEGGWERGRVGGREVGRQKRYEGRGQR